MDPPAKPKVALIAGPTASGKSALALALAEACGGVIVNADSAQVYRDLRLVSARPSAEEEARAPHRLYGFRDGADPFSAADWAEAAAREIEDAHGTGRLPILVGGTGLYLRTLLDGIAPVPPIDPDIRTEVRAMSVEESYRELCALDASAAARLRPSDTTRVARALEVIRSTGRSLLHWQSDRQGGIGQAIDLRPLILLPPRDWLHPRIDARFSEMMGEQGLEEVRSLLARGLDSSRPVMRAIGVPEIVAYLEGRLTREEALAAGRTATRRYAKRQYTWFRHQPPGDWRRYEQPLDEKTVAELLPHFIADASRLD